MARNMLLSCIGMVIVSFVLIWFNGFVGLPNLVLFLSKVVMLIGGVSSFVIATSLWLFGKNRTNALLTNVLLVMTTLVFLMITGELAVRFIFKDITTTGDGSGYFARKWYKNKKNVQRNSLGFREIGFDLDKPDAMYRIAVMGDSFIFGQGIKEKDRFSNLLGSYLNSKGRYQVLNFGTPSLDTIDNLPILRNIVLKTDPDFVILQWYINDFEGKNKRFRESGLRLLPSTVLCSILNRYSALYYLINLKSQSLRNAFSSGPNYVESLYQRFSNPMSPDSLEAKAALTEFIDECKNRGIGIGIVLFPSSDRDLGVSYPFAYLHERVLGLCDIKKIPCLDLRATFAQYAEKKQLWVNRFDGHPNALANRIAANRLIETFAPIWLSANVEPSVNGADFSGPR